MASKKTKNSIQVKLNVKKPITQPKKAAEEAARIRKNEQNRLYRLNKKFAGTKKKGEADKLRREIKGLEKDLRGITATVTDIREKAKRIEVEKKQIKSLKLQNAAITRKLNKKYSSRQFDKEYKDLNNQHIKNTGLIQDRIQKAAALTYEINKNLGFDPKIIAKNIDISNKTLEKQFSDDFEDDYFDTAEGAGGGKRHTAAGEEFEEEIIPDEVEPEEADEHGWVQEDADVFWIMWKDFESTEKYNLHNYDQVIFDFGGGTYKFKGTSLSLIIMKASEMWRFARENGSDTYVVKYKTLDEKKLKYTIDEI